MYTDKKSILQLAVLLKAHGVRKIVLCPGSRDIPIIQTLAKILISPATPSPMNGAQDSLLSDWLSTEEVLPPYAAPRVQLY